MLKLRFLGSVLAEVGNLSLTHISYLSNLLFFLLLDSVSECIVVTFDNDQIVTLGVDDKFSRRVAQWSSHLVEHRSQLLQSQNPSKKTTKLIIYRNICRLTSDFNVYVNELKQGRH